jgi:phosphoenolpyruvate-protein kinase (PTS system EI component)
MILTDPEFQEALFKTIEDSGCSATKVVAQELGLLRKQLANADSEYLRQRVDDMNEIEQGLLGYLNRVATERQCREALDCSLTEWRLGNDHILVSRELTRLLWRSRPISTPPAPSSKRAAPTRTV